MSWRYLLRRLIQVAVSVAAVLTITFVVIQLVPGDPFGAMAQEGQSAEEVASLRERYGLDRPLPIQFFEYSRNVLRGDLGESVSFGAPVREVIAERLWPTLLLSGSALAMSVPTGILLGIIAARRPGGPVDSGVRLFALIGYAVPSFFLAQAGILVVVLRWRMLPLLGMTDPRVDNQGLALIVDVIYHLILPATVLAISELALVTRLTRSGLVEEMGKDYVRTAHAKGVPPKRVLSDHALRNALLPVITVIGTRLGFLLGGAVIIEQIFSWPGLGTLLVGAARSGDQTLMLGLVLMLSFCLVVANLLTDFVYAWLDPRIRYD